jgi:hypothetical protein
MANRYVALTSSSASAAAATATVNGTKTILQLVASSTGFCTLIEWGIQFDNTNSVLAPIDVYLQRQTSAGTASAGTVQKWAPGAPAAQTTVQRAFTVEPTAGDLLAMYHVNPTSGITIQYPLGREPVLDLSTRLGLVTVGVTANISNALAYMVFEE